MEKRLLEELQMYRNELKRKAGICESRLNELDSCRGLNMKRRKSSKTGIHYYSAYDKEYEFSYIGSENSETVNIIKEYRYYKKSFEVLTCNLGAVNNLLETFHPSDYESINDMLPDIYKNPRLDDVLVGDEAKLWRERALALKNRYDIYKPEELINPTDDGNYVRSKSEAAIYNYLLSMGVTFIYELPMRIRGRLMVPDFTLLSELDNKTELIIEHQGMMSSEYYRRRFAEKLYNYFQEGYVHGINIFFTFDTPAGGFDKTPVEEIVRSRILLR